MFIDEIIINVKAGKGGDGCVSFRRERFIPRGGPDGGDGGRGGNVFIQVDSQIKTLIEYKRNPHHKAENGEGGSGRKKNGKKGKDLILRVPVGTVVENMKDHNIIADLSEPGERVCVAYGGSGGKGNYRFRNSIIQSPRFAQKGEFGEEKTVKLNLKLIADAALIGFPNVGKSTLLSRVSAAKPKIADYPFTTIEPYLGIVYVDSYNQFILADIPGLIEGAHQGAGLGIRFLKHIERTKVLVHMIDGSKISEKNIMEDYTTVKNELKQFSQSLKNKKELIVINKCDLPEVEKRIEEIRNIFSKKSKNIFFISAVTGKGVQELIYQIFKNINLVEKKELTPVFHPQNKIAHYRYKPAFIIRREGKQFVIEGEKISKLVYQYDLANPQALKYLQEKLKGLGIEKVLKQKGARDGDIVRIGEKEFYFFS
ncbi:MAG: GTPase ObgE [Atribacterota bacterium]|nr:GTPase ObgE [Atribacterota bacterium]MDD4895204.1 GTPase ObgE [Atribacterota bacterium]MDD5636478.1 GTPase ObgE [Atribacterota bacterium]